MTTDDLQRASAQAAIRAYMRQNGGPSLTSLATLFDGLQNEIRTCFSGSDSLKKAITGRLDDCAFDICAEYETAQQEEST